MGRRPTTSSASWCTTPAASSAVRSRSPPTITRRPSRASPTARRPTSSSWRTRHYYEPAGPGAVWVRSIAASTGGLGPVHEVAVGVACYVPQMEYNPSTNQFLVAWYQQPHIYGRLLGADGSPAGNVTALILNYDSYDALGLRYNPQTRDVLRGGARTAARRRRRARCRAPPSPTSSSTSRRPARETAISIRASSSNRRTQGVDGRHVQRLRRRVRAAHQLAQRRRRRQPATAPPPPPPPPPQID